jgi:hypothetical protein
VLPFPAAAQSWSALPHEIQKDKAGLWGLRLSHTATIRMRVSWFAECRRSRAAVQLIAKTERPSAMRETARK